MQLTRILLALLLGAALLVLGWLLVLSGGEVGGEGSGALREEDPASPAPGSARQAGTEMSLPQASGGEPGSERVEGPGSADGSAGEGAPRPEAGPGEGPDVLAGTISVDGHEPGVTLFLSLESSAAEPRPGTAATDGTFRFDGLAAGWSGRLRIRGPYEVDEPGGRADADPFSCSVHLAQAAAGLRLELRSRPALTGRFVEASSRRPAGEVAFALALRLEGGETRRVAARSDERGRFFYAPGDLERLAQVEIRVDEGFDAMTRDFDAEDLRGLDLGEIELSRTPHGGGKLKLEVVDRAGDPVPWARARIDKGEELETGDEGTAILPGVRGGEALAVYAHGFRVARVRVADTPPSVVTVELERTNLLTVRALGPEGKRPSGVDVVLIADEPPFRGGRGGRGVDEGEVTPDPELLELYALRWSRAGADELGRIVDTLTTDWRGMVEIPDLRPGLSLTLRAVDAYGTVLTEVSIAPLGPEEQREVELLVSRAPRTLSGRVVDPAGAPLSGVSVYARIDASSARGALTDGDGRFLFEDLYADTLRLEVEHEGPSVPPRDVPIPPAGAEIEIVVPVE